MTLLELLYNNVTHYVTIYGAAVKKNTSIKIYVRFLIPCCAATKLRIRNSVFTLLEARAHYFYHMTQDDNIYCLCQPDTGQHCEIYYCKQCIPLCTSVLYVLFPEPFYKNY